MSIRDGLAIIPSVKVPKLEQGGNISSSCNSMSDLFVPMRLFIPFVWNKRYLFILEASKNRKVQFYFWR